MWLPCSLVSREPGNEASCHEAEKSLTWWLIICAGVVCQNLPNPENGQVVQIINGNIPGTVANYSCDSGYTLVGNMSRVCVQVNREEEVWTGEAPTCQRKEIYW